MIADVCVTLYLLRLVNAKREELSLDNQKIGAKVAKNNKIKKCYYQKVWEVS